MYEIFEQLLSKYGVTAYKVAKETGITTATLTNWKQGKYTPKQDKLQKIADYFGVSLEYLMTGKEDAVKEKAPELTARDERDIKKDLDNIMEKIRNGEDGPLYYGGTEIDSASLSLLQNAFEYALRETKKENKVKYNPNKNKKQVTPFGDCKS